MTKSIQITFFGSDNFSSVILRNLLLSNVAISNIVTSPEKRSGRGRNDQSHPVIDIAKQHNIPFSSPDSLINLRIKDLNPVQNTLAVLASYGKIIPVYVLEMFCQGIVNVHPSLLPRWRGPSPIESAILNGDKTTGVTLMQLAKAMDEGPIYTSKSIPLTGSETKTDLYNNLSQIGAELLDNYLPKISSDQLTPTAQPTEGVTYSAMISKNDGVIAWTDDVEQIERQIRAYEGWPQSHTVLAEKDVIVTSVSIYKKDPNTVSSGLIIPDKNHLLVSCKNGVLEIRLLKPVGKNEMSGQDFIRGYLR